MSRDDIRQMVIEIADNIYNKDNDLSNKTLSEIYANIHNDFEKLLVEILYQMQRDVQE